MDMNRTTLYSEQETRMTGRGSAGNVISALASFLYPGLGQLVQGRILAALLFFVMATLLWFVLLGWIIHIWAAIDAARYEP
jgi:TM2 domain-containing membrane protein YozV